MKLQLTDSAEIAGRVAELRADVLEVAARPENASMRERLAELVAILQGAIDQLGKLRRPN